MAQTSTVCSSQDACLSPESFVAWSEELLGLEQSAEDEETTELLMTCTHAELQARGIAVLRLCVAEQTTALFGRACLTLERHGGDKLPVHRITHGDIVGIFDQNTKPLSKAVPLASAVVQRVRPTSFELAFDSDIPTEILDGRQLNLASVSSEVTLKRYREALDMLKSGRSDCSAAGLISLCFNADQRPRFHEVKSDICCRQDAVDCTFLAEQSHALNEPQQAAVVKALRAIDMAIIHGPPGTGKTTTLVAYILEATYRKQKLLVTAPSNVAVDNLLERVVHCGCRSVVRLGHPARVQSDLHKYTMDNVVYASDQAALCRDIKKDIDAITKRGRGGSASGPKQSAKATQFELNALRKELRQRERRAVAEVLKHTQVVFATCAGAATLHREIRRKGTADSTVGKLEFDVVVIDEAAQALEVSCWIPLQLGKKGVLAGDHQQLAACVKSKEAVKRGLDRTLFARMIERHGDDVAALLSIQYRMNSIIMGWSSRSFYDSRLEAAESVAERTLELVEAPAENLLGDTLDALRKPLLFVDTGGLALYREDGQDDAKARHDGESGNVVVHQSRGNPGEARFLVHYAKMLVRCGLNPKDITVISPYNRQVELLRAEFAQDAEGCKLGLEAPRVNTVDSFQGQEADAVLISLVRSNDRGIVGFLADYRRLNVAVTRARKHVMLVGDAATICSDGMLASLYDYACEHAKVLFVQQLLDEEGNVPADPSTVREPQHKKKIGGPKQTKAVVEPKDEEEVRKRFDSQFNRLLETKGRVDFPSSLNSFERAIAHEVATTLGLLHESRGEGMNRQLSVWAPGAEARPSESQNHGDSVPQPGIKSDATREAGTAKLDPKAKGPTVDPVALDAESGSDDETALQAFERRASALLDSLGSGRQVAEWKSPTDEEEAIIRKVTGAKGMQLVIVGSGKKRRCRVEVEASQSPAAAAEAAVPSTIAAPANALLSDLHAARKQNEEMRRKQQDEDAQMRREKNEEVKVQIKAAKKTGKQKLAAVAKAEDDDDLDAVLLEFASKDGICAFGTCKEKVHTLMDAISKCRHCSKRFCVAHAQAEVHGCGDAAHKDERQKWKQGGEAALNPRGGGLVNRPCGDNRAAIANKLQDKLQGSQAGRTTKKKDAKK